MMAEAKKIAKKTVKKTKMEELQDGPIKESNPVTVQTDQEPKDQVTNVESKKAEKVVAKAGKRSAKSLKEAEIKAVKESKKAAITEEPNEAKKPTKLLHKPARSKLERSSKKYKAAAAQIDINKEYALKEALELATKTSTTKFDATVELHFRLGVDPRQADQNIRDNLVLPAGTGKQIRIAVFADVDDAKAAKAAGADIAANEELLTALDKGEINFDVLIATPDMMPKLGKHARVLGPKGLMPNPKSGTVTKDVAKAVTEAKAGRVEYRVDSTGIVHLGIGKVSFGGAKLLENASAVVASLKANKPSSLKANYVRSIFVTTSMGPSIRVAVSEV